MNAERPLFQAEIFNEPVVPVVRQRGPLGNIVSSVDAFTRIYSRFPFSGKLFTTPIARDSFSERDSRVKKVKAIKGATLMGAFAFAHAAQAGMGISLVEQVDLQQVGNPWVDFQLAIASMYFLANTGAVITQSRLTTRILGNINDSKSSEVSWRQAIKKGLPVSLKGFRNTGSQALFMVGVTAVGQTLFMIAQSNA